MTEDPSLCIVCVDFKEYRAPIYVLNVVLIFLEVVRMRASEMRAIDPLYPHRIIHHRSYLVDERHSTRLGFSLFE